MQTRARDREDFESALHDAISQTIEAGERGARLIVLPEGTVPAYVIGDEPIDAAQLERAHEAFAEVAKRFDATIVYGAARIVDGRTYNAAMVIGPSGVLLGAPAKHFLWHFDRRWFTPGETLEPIDTPVGKLGILVCADGRIPTIAKTLVDRGAEILVMPTAWVTSGRNPDDLENVQADLFVSVRAHENHVPFVVANKAGVERQSVAYCGKSTIVGADGVTIERAPQSGEAVIVAEVELGTHGEERSARGLMASALYLQSAYDDTISEPRTRARIAITTAHDPAELGRLAASARIAEATHLIAPGPLEDAIDGLFSLVATNDGSGTTACGGLRFEIVTYRRLKDPAALVPARLAGIDLFICTAFDIDDAMGARYIRTRAMELRAYVIAIDRRKGRAFACDPDGTFLAGTFGDFRIAAFAYDRARSDASLVAPGTDVLEGLRAVEPIYRATIFERYPELASAE